MLQSSNDVNSDQKAEAKTDVMSTDSTAILNSTSESSGQAESKEDQEKSFFDLSGYDKAVRIGEILLYGIDRIGEVVCKFTGITDSKYQYAVDYVERQQFYAELEQKRLAEERAKEREAMLAAGIDPEAAQEAIELEQPSGPSSHGQALPLPPITNPVLPRLAPQSQLPSNINAFAKNVVETNC